MVPELLCGFSRRRSAFGAQRVRRKPTTGFLPVLRGRGFHPGNRDEIRRERDILAFAVQAYQDERPKPEPIVVDSLPAAETVGKCRSVMDRVREAAMRNPGTAREISDRIGVDIRRTAATLSTLAKRGQIPHIGTIWGGRMPPQGK